MSIPRDKEVIEVFSNNKSEKYLAPSIPIPFLSNNLLIYIQRLTEVTDLLFLNALQI
jgi:hypothetical protein